MKQLELLPRPELEGDEEDTSEPRMNRRVWQRSQRNLILFDNLFHACLRSLILSMKTNSC